MITRSWHAAAIGVVLALLGAGSRVRAGDEAFSLPRLEVDEKLGQILSFSSCEYISGLTCRVRYNGKAPLPSEVFFTEFDGVGKQAGGKTRLIYPRLASGESGAATFRLKSSSPARIRLQALWEGSWKSPY